MKVRLNLATNPVQTHRKFLAVSGLIGAFAGLLIALALGWHVYSVRKSNETLRREANRKTSATEVLWAACASARTPGKTSSREEQNAKLNERSAFLNGFLDRRAEPQLDADVHGPRENPAQRRTPGQHRAQAHEKGQVSGQAAPVGASSTTRPSSSSCARWKALPPFKGVRGRTQRTKFLSRKQERRRKWITCASPT